MLTHEAMRHNAPLARGLGSEEQIRWPLQRSGDIFELRYGKALTEASRQPGSVPVYGSNGQTGTHDSSLFPGPGVILGRKGMGHLGVEWADDDFWVIDTAYSLKALIDMELKFAYYLIRYVGLDHLKHGTSNPSLTRDAFAAQMFPVPPIGDQRAIAEVLGALDDKIAANDRVVAISDALARARFAALAERGPRVGIGEVATMVKRGVAPKYDDAGMIVLNQKCIRDQRVSLEPSRWMAPLTSRLDRVLERNDTLVNSTGQGTLGRVARWVLDAHATADSHVTIVRFDSSLVDPVCAGYGVLEVESQIEGLAEGSTGQTELKRDLLSGLEIRLPERSEQVALGEQLTEIDRLTVSLGDESRRLAATRDELLPLLMSGKVRVKDAEKVAEELT